MPTFAGKPEPTAEKLRGGYYTPAPIAEFLARWVAAAGGRLLEPSCGDGAVLRELVRCADDPAKVVGVERVATEAKKARRSGGKVHTQDFFQWFNPKHEGAFDGVAGNPPYIRFGHWPEADRGAALALMERAGLHTSRLTNAWLPFTVASALALREGGRLGLVLPGELLQVGYAAGLRSFLVDQFAELTLVSFRELLFPGVLQEVVLLLGVRGVGPARVRAVEFASSDDLAAADWDRREFAPGLRHDTEKWTKYFLTKKQIDALRTLRDKGLNELGKYASIEVGVVTGRNSFFTMSKEDATGRRLIQHCMPLVARSGQLPGMKLTTEDLEDQESRGFRTCLLALDATKKPRGSVLAYIEEGEAYGVHTGYKCSIRNQWWSVPSIWIPDGFFLRQIATYPKLVVNETSATSTDTVHRVRLLGTATAKEVALSCFNSASFALAEVIGRSYGGGILELEPREAEGLPVVPAEQLDEAVFEEVDRLLRAGDFEAALVTADRATLVDALGWKPSEVATMREIWERLRDRRAHRGSSSRKGK